ncbi:MAG: sugar phosphate isomerase/epimerase [Phycisphaerales bacterium]|nr:sugar phosphate isomerase/epimerase [Phycisphaerales bacterium]
MIPTISVAAFGLEPSVDTPFGALQELPSWAARELEVRGMNVPATMLAGATGRDFEHLRDQADRFGCPVLVLEQRLALDLSSPESSMGSAERMHALATAAVRLGASHVSVALKADNDETSLERVASILREVMAEVEQHELTLMLLPQEGLTDDPERLMALVKLVGGFRIGIQPSIKHAMAHGGLEATMRRLAPYAASVVADDVKLIPELVELLQAVGYENTIALHPIRAHQLGSWKTMRDVLHTAIHGESEA